MILVSFPALRGRTRLQKSLKSKKFHNFEYFIQKNVYNSFFEKNKMYEKICKKKKRFLAL